MEHGTGTVKKILAAADLTETGANALRAAMGLTRELKRAELHVVYVVSSDESLHDAKRIAELDERISERTETLKGHVLNVCSPRGEAAAFHEEVVLHIRLGKPAAAIHQCAVDIDADLIVVGTHRRKGLEKLLIGSVAKDVMEIARVPVLIAHPKSFEGLEKSPRADAPSAITRQELPAHMESRRVHLEFQPRTSHIAGLI